MPCHCAACRLRRLWVPLTLIVLGAVLLAHMLVPGFSRGLLAAVFLLFLGGWQLLIDAAAVLRPASPAHRPGPGSFFTPLLLIALAVLILVRHFHPLYPIGAWIAAYWPLLLIVWGLARLIEHFAAGPRARSGFTGGEIILLVLIVVFGLAFSGAYHFGHSRWAGYWGVDVDAWNPFQQTYTFTASAHTRLAPGQSVRIEAARGSIRLVPANAPGSAPSPASASSSNPAAPNLDAAVSYVVHADGRAAAQRLFAAAQPILRLEGSRLLVRPAGDRHPGRVGADLVLTLPPGTPVSIALGSGTVSAQDWRAPLDIHSTHGAVILGHIAASVSIAAGHGSVSLDHIDGAVHVTGSGSDVAISNVVGPTSLDGAFAGSLSFRNLAGGLRFSSPRTRLRLAALLGRLEDDMGAISIDNASAIDLRTRDEEVDIRRFTGPLQVRTRNRPVILTAAAPPADPVAVATSNADITFELPASSRFRLRADAHNGEVRSAFPATASGPEFHLATSNGAITLRPPPPSLTPTATSGSD